MDEAFKGHRHWVAQKEPTAYKAPQEPQTKKAGEHAGRRADGGPVLRSGPSTGISEGRAAFLEMKAARGLSVE